MRVGVLVFALACGLCCFAFSHSSEGPGPSLPGESRALTAGLAAITSAAIGTANSPTKPATESAKTQQKVNFETQIKPILANRCQPCHFSGGKVYQPMPFDRPETITTLGTKLLTRIKDEDERRLIRDFLAQ